MCDYEPPEFCDSTIVKARKHHKCCECNRTIYPKEEYEKTVGKWDGEFQEFKACMTCVLVRAEYNKYLRRYDDPCGPCIGGLWESLHGSSIDRPNRSDGEIVNSIRKMWAEHLWLHRKNTDVNKHLRTANTKKRHWRKKREAQLAAYRASHPEVNQPSPT